MQRIDRKYYPVRHVGLQCYLLTFAIICCLCKESGIKWLRRRSQIVKNIVMNCYGKSMRAIYMRESVHDYLAICVLNKFGISQVTVGLKVWPVLILLQMN